MKEIIHKLGFDMVVERDRVIMEVCGASSVSELVGRLERVRKRGDRFEVWVLDGKGVLELHDPELSGLFKDGLHKITAVQKYREL